MPEIPWSQTLIYEAHVRGYTIRHEGLPHHLRGTFAGFGPSRNHQLPANRFGITAVELMPVHCLRR
jgi:pullulanase/glycogen debranching enzyme